MNVREYSGPLSAGTPKRTTSRELLPERNTELLGIITLRLVTRTYESHDDFLGHTRPGYCPIRASAFASILPSDSRTIGFLPMAYFSKSESSFFS
jgi:hypothetical protein